MKSTHCGAGSGAYFARGSPPRTLRRVRARADQHQPPGSLRRASNSPLASGSRWNGSQRGCGQRPDRRAADSSASATLVASGPPLRLRQRLRRDLAVATQSTHSRRRAAHCVRPPSDADRPVALVAPAAKARREGITGRSRLEGRGRRTAETASSKTDCTRDSAAARGPG
jgi:hypothetical protein